MKRCCLLPRLAAFALLAALPDLRATTVVAPDFEQLVNSADYVVRATVRSVVSDWRPHPAKPGRHYIGTRVELEVLEVISGNPPSPLVLDLVGGRIGEQALKVDGAPDFRAGDEHILFIRGNGRFVVPLVGMQHGAYPILRDQRTGEARVMRSGGKFLYDEREVSLPDTVAGAAPAHDPQAKPLSPAEFARRIRSAHKSADRERLK